MHRAAVLALLLLPAAPAAQAGAPETPGVFDRESRRFELFHDLADAVPDEEFAVTTARPRLLPVAGDWDGDGLTDLGVYDPARRQFRLFTDRKDGASEVEIPLRTHRPWLRPVAGDFDGDGRDEPAVYDRYARRFSLLGADGRLARVLQLSGRRPDRLRPFAGDFDGDGRDELGLYDARARSVHLLPAAGGTGERTLRVAERAADLRPVAFDPDGDGRDGLGLFDRQTGRLAFLADLADGDTDADFELAGAAGRRLWPVAGVWREAPGEAGVSDVPDTDLCRPVAGVDPAWAAFESELLALLNARRAAGASCGSEGDYPPAPPLAADPRLRCAVRLHVRDLAARDAVTQFGADGSVTETRAAAAGYPALFAGEAVSGGTSAPAEVLAAWLADPLTCAMLMEPVFRDGAVGFADVPGGRRFYWVLDVGVPTP